MPLPIMIPVSDLHEAAVAIDAVEAYRAKKSPTPSVVPQSSPLADRIYAALKTSTFTKPSQIVTRVLLAHAPGKAVPLTAISDEFVKEGLSKTTDEAWRKQRAAFANLSWLMAQRLSPEDIAGAAKPVDVFAMRSLDQHGRREYRLSDAGRIAAQRFFNDQG